MPRTRAGVAAALAMVLMGTSQGQETGGQETSPFTWRADLAAARAQAKHEGRPLLVVFR